MGVSWLLPGKEKSSRVGVQIQVKLQLNLDYADHVNVVVVVFSRLCL